MLLFMKGRNASFLLARVFKKEMLDSLSGTEYIVVGDCCGNHDSVNAGLVIAEVLARRADDSLKTCSYAAPMYLRPSQAERMANRANM